MADLLVMEQKSQREQVDTANEPVDFDDDEMVDTGVLHEPRAKSNRGGEAR